MLWKQTTLENYPKFLIEKKSTYVKIYDTIFENKQEEVIGNREQKYGNWSKSKYLI